MEQGPVLILTFNAQQVMVLRDATGNVVEGGEVGNPYIESEIFIIQIYH